MRSDSFLKLLRQTLPLNKKRALSGYYSRNRYHRLKQENTLIFGAESVYFMHKLCKYTKNMHIRILSYNAQNENSNGSASFQNRKIKPKIPRQNSGILSAV